MRRFKNSTVLGRYSCLAPVLLVALGLSASVAWAQDRPSDRAGVMGRVEFDFASTHPAKVEIDLGPGMIEDVSGIGEAAIKGVVDALSDSDPGNEDGPVQQSAEHLAAFGRILASLSGVLHEVRIRVYEDLPEDASAPAAVVTHYQEKLSGTAWDNVIRVRDGDERVAVCVRRDDGAIRGLFFAVAGSDELVLANIVCELTPEKVEQVTNQATQIGLKVGLAKAIHEAMDELERELR